MNKFMEEEIFCQELDSLTYLLSRLTITNEYTEEFLLDIFGREKFSERNKKPHKCINLFGQICLTTFQWILNFISLLLFLYLFIISHNSVQKFVMRNSQTYIYPTMRMLRVWTLPYLRKYEFFSDWHEEECLLKNPFYYEVYLDCWPCQDVRTLVDLTGFPNYSSNYVLNEQPFIVRDSLQKTVSYQKLKKIYNQYSWALDRGTARFLCSEKDLCSPKDVFTKKHPPKASLSFHVMWKINRVAAARILRKTFPRPYFIPNNSEVALERYLYLSGTEASQFFLPLTDFANVWIAQGQGYRLIILDPSEPCNENCTTVSVLLRPRDVLYYNWQFWRPRLHSTNFSQDISVTFVGSFY